MSWITAHHNQDVTYWAKSGKDASGDPSFATPVAIKARWEERAVAFTNFRGEAGSSMALAFLGQTVTIGGFLFLGTSAVASPFSVVGSLEIQGISDVPSLEGNVSERKAFLTSRTVR